MKTTPGRLRALTLGARADAEIVFVLPDGTHAEIESATPEKPERGAAPKTGRPSQLSAPNRIIVQMKRSLPAVVSA